MTPIEELKEIISHNERYKGMVLLQREYPFSEIFEDDDIPVVQLHSAQTYVCDTQGNKDIVGFCGAFEWKDNEVIPLDGDTYNKDFIVLGYEWWKNPAEHIQRGLDVLVGDDW